MYYVSIKYMYVSTEQRSINLSFKHCQLRQIPANSPIPLEILV